MPSVALQLYTPGGTLARTVKSYTDLRFAHELLGGCGDLSLRTEGLLPQDVPLEGEARLLLDGAVVYSGCITRGRKDPSDAALTEVFCNSWSNYFNRVWPNYFRDFPFDSDRRTEADEVVDRMISLAAVTFTAHASNATLDNTASIGTKFSGGLAAALEAIGRREPAPGAVWGIDHLKQIYCLPIVTAVSTYGYLHAGHVETYALERSTAQLCNALHLTGVTPQEPNNALSNPMFLEVENSESRYYYYASPLVKCYAGLFRNWTISVENADGSVAIANTYNLGGVGARPDSRYSYAFGDYGPDIGWGCDATVNTVEIRPMYSSYAAGLGAGTDVFTRETDARPKISASSVVAVSARLWQDAAEGVAEMRWTVKTYNGNTLVGTHVQPAWVTLTDGWNFATVEGSGTGWTFTAEANADCCLPILELRNTAASSYNRVVVDGLLCMSPYISTIDFTPSAVYEVILAVDDTFMTAEDANIKASITNYGYRQLQLGYQGDGLDLAKEFAKAYFRRFALPFWRGSVVAKSSAFPGYYPWAGRLQLHDLPSDESYARLSSDGVCPALDCTRVDYTIKPDFVCATYNVQSAGVLQELSGDLSELGYYPLPPEEVTPSTPTHAPYRPGRWPLIR